eukprot:TRINITY_DN43478_c0_g1_i1.p2 TRINITY_DN43478_c0_g1~~TRINITY_DN43478_c0_g1_i1.p2  ORF type:complete len:130 (+),score=43.55 TRINITY_DN43478_c0_g1_i1:129-518(+)
MGGVSSLQPRPTGPAPIFYTEEFLQKYAASDPQRASTGAESPGACGGDMSSSLKAVERQRLLAEIREEELASAEAAAKRISSWATAQKERKVPCMAEQAEVERCYASPPGGDQLKCASVVNAYAQCAKL